VAVPVSPPVAEPVAVESPEVPETAEAIVASLVGPVSAGASPTPAAPIKAIPPASAPTRTVRFNHMFMSLSCSFGLEDLEVRGQASHSSHISCC